jgi:GNAT superfamily N-acetyltransferase
VSYRIEPLLGENHKLPPQRIPALLLAKLALDQRLQGQGLGAELLAHALTTIVTAARSAGGRIVVVDANRRRRGSVLPGTRLPAHAPGPSIASS